MFERQHHRNIAGVLAALDGPMLSSLGCLFGGGTAIVLARGEYRQSLDIDFLVSHAPGYRELRLRLTAGEGLAPITRAGCALPLARDVRADAYGIRTLVRAGDAGEAAIKLEILFEARITLDPPGPSDVACGVPRLTLLDMAASKLLANSDRWSDRAVHSRDLIDLAMLEAPRAVLAAAVAKAEQAYGDAIRRDLLRAVDGLRGQPQRLAECMAALGIDGVPRALLWSRIRGLVKGVAAWG